MTEAERSAVEGRALLLYDGVCALCHGMVKFLMKRDRGHRFRYAPLQSELGREMLGRLGIEGFPDGVVLVTDVFRAGERVYQRSDAVAASLRLLDGPWQKVGRVLLLVPRWLREWGYGVVARVRYRVFGRYDTCPVPLPEERDRLLGVYE
jgi:predicted DCC family thiol-disulfide oxidoreductase YuxK